TIKTRSFAECSVRAKAAEGYFLGNRRCPSCSWAAGTLNWHTAVRRLLSRCLKSMKRSLRTFLSASQPAVTRVVRAHVASRIALGWSFAGRPGELPLPTRCGSSRAMVELLLSTLRAPRILMIFPESLLHCRRARNADDVHERRKYERPPVFQSTGLCHGGKRHGDLTSHSTTSLSKGFATSRIPSSERKRTRKPDRK